jgi:hypothetical protein
MNASETKRCLWIRACVNDNCQTNLKDESRMWFCLRKSFVLTIPSKLPNYIFPKAGAQPGVAESSFSLRELV